PVPSTKEETNHVETEPESKDTTRRTVLPALAPGVCWACGTRRRWRSVYGVVICARCHPPADAARWLPGKGKSRARNNHGSGGANACPVTSEEKMIMRDLRISRKDFRTIQRQLSTPRRCLLCGAFPTVCNVIFQPHKPEAWGGKPGKVRLLGYG